MHKKIGILFLYLSFSVALFAQTTSWTGRLNEQWDDAENWTMGVPTDSVVAVLGDSCFTGGFEPIVSSSSRCKALLLDSLVPLTLTVANELFVQGDLYIVSVHDSLRHTAAKLTVRGNWFNKGVYLPAMGSSAKVAFGGVVQSLSGSGTNAFNLLHVNGGSQLNLHTSITAKKVSLNGIFMPCNTSAPLLTADSILVNTTGELWVSASSFAQNYSSIPICVPGAVVCYHADSNQVVESGICYATLKLSGRGVKRLEADLLPLLSSELLAGRIYVNQGVFDLGLFRADRGTDVPGGYFTVEDSACLRIGGETSDHFPGNFKTTSLKDASTVEYYGNGTQLVCQKNYGNLVLTATDGVATKLLPTTQIFIDGSLHVSYAGADSLAVVCNARIIVGGNFVVDSGSVFYAGNYAHTVAGDFTNYGGYLSDNGSLTLLGANNLVRGYTHFDALFIKGSYVVAADSRLEVVEKMHLVDSAYCLVPESTVLHLATLRLDARARFENQGEMLLADSLIFVSTDTVTAQLINKGTVSTTALVCVEKNMQAIKGWYFMAFPFEVHAQNIRDAFSGDTLTWGGVEGVADCYVLEYNGVARDALGKPNTSGEGVYWKEVSTQIMVPYKGYIVAVEEDRTVLFISPRGADAIFAKIASVSLQAYTSNSSAVHHSWNIRGNPFSSSFNLSYANQAQCPFYVYDGFTYQTIMAGDSYILPPFSAFFVQAIASPLQLLFAAEGVCFRTVTAPTYTDELDLYIKNDGFSDRCRIRMAENARLGYNQGADGVKLLSMNRKVPQLYAKLTGVNYAVKSLPFNPTQATTVPLSFYSPKAGKYTISLPKHKECKAFEAVYLVDATLACRTNLLEDSAYHFSSAQQETNSTRFSILLVPKANTANVLSDATSVFLSVHNNSISFGGLHAKASVLVYDVYGRQRQLYKDVVNYEKIDFSHKGLFVFLVSTGAQQEIIKQYFY